MSAETITETPAARIVLRPLASPLPLGFLAFGTGVMLATALEAHWMSGSQSVMLAALAFAFVAPLELVAMVFGFLERDTAAGTTMGLFALSWVALALYQLLLPPDAASGAMGWFSLMLAASTVLLGSVALASKPFFSLILYLAGFRFVLQAVHMFRGGAARGALAALSIIDGIALVALSLYGALALLLEDGRKHTVLPLFRKGPARAALEGGAGDQLRDVLREPGVRSEL